MADSLRDRQRGLREDVILEAARDLLMADGYQKMSMDGLAARVGIAKMTLYQHFPSKEALVVAMIVRGMQRTEAALLPVITSSQPALTRLRTLLATGLDKRSVFWAIELDLLPGTIHLNPAYQTQYARFTEHWTALISQAKAEGTIDPSLSTPVLARVLMQAFQTGYDDLVQSGAASPDELAHTLLTLLIRGMQG